MKYLFTFLMLVITVLYGCKTTRQINKAIAPKDSVNIINDRHEDDSVLKVKTAFSNLQQHYINFKTFNAKVKVDWQNNKGKRPDITAVIRIIKDSAIWMSLSATFLNIEVYRVLITKDSVVLLNKQEKEVQHRSLDYLQEVTEIPFDYNTLQDLLVGNPVFLDSNIVSYKKTEKQILLSVIGKYFKHLLTISSDNYLLLHSKLDDTNINRNRTADITYSGYENKNGFNFPAHREITVSEKNKLDIQFNYKQYEFNKELSVSFNIPKNYKRT